MGHRNWDPSATSVLSDSMDGSYILLHPWLCPGKITYSGPPCLWGEHTPSFTRKVSCDFSAFLVPFLPSALSSSPHHQHFLKPIPFFLQFKHPPKSTLIAHTPFPPIKGIRKNVTLFLVLISKPQRLGKNKDKISSLCLPKNQWSLSGTSKKCCNLYGCSAKFQATAPNPGWTK